MDEESHPRCRSHPDAEARRLYLSCRSLLCSGQAPVGAGGPETCQPSSAKGFAGRLRERRRLWSPTLIPLPALAALLYVAVYRLVDLYLVLANNAYELATFWGSAIAPGPSGR